MSRYSRIWAPLPVGAVVTPWTPASLTSLWAWWDFSDTATITASGGTVTQVTDKSGNSRTMFAGGGGGGNGPTTGTRTVNGLNGLDCVAASSQWLNMATGSGSAQPISVLCVVSLDLSADSRFFDCGSGSRAIGRINAGNYALFAGGGADSTQAAATGAQQLVFVFNSTSSKFYKNGTQFGGSLDPSTGGIIASDFIEIMGDTPSMDGIACEFVVTTAAVSAGDITSWSAYTLAKWGV